MHASLRPLGLAVLAACRPAPPDLPPSPPADAVTLLADRCDRDEGPACLEVAMVHRDRGDRPRSLAYLTRACDLASARGCAALADALAAGDGVPRDPARALDLRVQACLGGLASACSAAADELPPDQARDFRRRACVAGDQASCPPPPPPPAPVLDPRDHANVVLALAGRREAMRACYRAALMASPGLRGRVVLQVAIGPGGPARAVAIAEGLDPDFDTCLATIVARTEFAPSTTGDVVVVDWRATFEPDE